ncbi:MAG: FAD-dependent oxidoreductase, partial [Myxococcota bacterium]
MASPRRSSRPSKRPRIVVLGGGFAGLAAAQTLRADRFDVTLVDQRRAFEWLPNIHELLSGVKRPEDLRLPLDELVRRAGHRFVRDAVVAIDPEARAIIPRRRKLPLPYDALIVACGGVDATRGVAGVREHAHGFKSVEECDRIGRRLARLGKRRRPAEVVIVGGGLEGVEALGEILRRPDAANLHVTLVEAGPRLLAEAPASLDRHVRALCADDAVVFETNAPVARIEADAVVLADGRTRPTDLTIWTGGPAPPDLLAASRLAPADAWAAVDRTLQSKDHPEIFVAGDAAELPTPLARQGYHALDMGRCAAANAMRQRDDRPLRAFRPSEKPMLIAFGDRSTFLVAGKRVLAGLPLASAKEAVFEVVL